MSNPTRQEIIEAYAALDALEHSAFKGAENRTEEEISLYRKSVILAALPPKPRPTMAEVEWDGDKHRFAEAEHEYRDRVVMLSAVGVDGIKCLEKDGDSIFVAARCLLTPTGKRYTLTEVHDD